MKKSVLFLAFLLMMASAGFVSCSKDDDTDAFVDITNPQSVQNALRIKQSTVIRGAFPEALLGSYDLSASIRTVQVNSGNNVILPLMYLGALTIKTVFIQVIGAENYFSVTPVLVTGTYGYVSITIPKNIDDGSFSIRYLVQDAAGNNSNVVTSIIYVTNEVISCSNAHASGEQGLTFTTVYLGDKSGEVEISYNTYTVPDRIDIYQGESWITGTGSNPNSLIPPMCNCSNVLPGFVGKRGYFTFNYDASKGQTVTVVVSGCLNGGTAWEWQLVKAPNCQ